MLARKRHRLSLVTALVTLLTVLVIPTGGAFAADVGPIDCVSPTLTAAITAANPSDTIIITDGSTCAGNFTVNKSLTIRAESATGATLDGLNVDGAPVLSVGGGATVTLQDLTITKGLNSAGSGGGINVIAGATVNVVSSTITLNSAANGGGVHSQGVVNLSSSSVVSSNTATDVVGGGGGVWSDGTLNVTDSTITSNTAANAGGGIHNISGGDVVITNSTVSNNNAAAAGGILNNNGADSGSTTTISGSTVSGNGATDVAGLGGGGIYNISAPTDLNPASLTITNSTISGNTSANAGAAGIRNDESTAGLTGATITGNVATGSGGGIRTSGTMTVTNSTISSNSATSSGGGIALEGGATSTLSVSGSVIDDNTATSGGGGVSASGAATATVSSSSITRNDAANGAGLSNGTGATLTVTNSTVSANLATSQGGGFFAQGDLTVNHSTVTANDATSEGGGVRVIGVPTVTLTGTILHGNTGGSGGDCSGPLASGGYNLIGSQSAPCVYTSAGTDLPPLSDPMLGALGFYGETTEHHPLLDGSDAVDAGGACGLGTDQIGTTRALGAACDIGALEDVFDQVLLVEPNGRWHIRIPGQADRTFWYGDPADVPIFGDWDGDGIDTPGAYRQGPGGGFAYLTNSLPGDGAVGVADFNFFFGDPGDEVFIGDWNGDGVDTLGVNRGGHMFLTDTNGSGGAPVPTAYDFFFGVDGDRAFGGDADGDGDDGVFLYRGSGPGAGFVYFTNETPVGPGGVASTADFFFFGIASDQFASGDWNGDGVDTSGIFRPSDTTVYLTNTNASGGAAAPTDESFVWGTAGWVPVAGVWADTPT